MARRRGPAVLLAVLVTLAACAIGEELPGRRAGQASPPTGRWAEQYHWLPVTEADGASRLILARLCHPGGASPRRLAVINHGKAPLDSQRAAYAPPSCDAEAPRWFLERDFAVIIPVRRGYGASGGAMAERHPNCTPARDYAASGLETARDIQAAITYATAQPGVLPDHVLVVGQSAGGLGAVALSSLNDRRVAALVNFAGGDGGRMNQVAHAVCEPPALIRAMARFGATARTPTLWIYTENDTYFSPSLAEAMHRAYVDAGGRARMAALPAWGSDGHTLFFGRGGSAVWGPLLDGFLGFKLRTTPASALRRN